MSGFTGTVLITGATAGIGAACARAFGQAGARLILAGRRVDRLEALAGELRDAHGTDSHRIALDVRDAGVVSRVLEDLPTDWRAVDLLINNAGLARGLAPIQEGEFRDWEEMIDTNVKGVLYVTRAVLPGMVRRGRGHVINIGSIVASEVAPNAAVYSATKAALETITTGLRLDLFGTPIRVTIVHPGLVETEFSVVRFRGDEQRAADIYAGYKPLEPADIADAVLYAATRPPHVNIDQLTVKPTAQARVGMIDKK
ncbi:MAG: SDR family NAD(P)-dependent oxidoreductase [Gemmatimonadetes bacterium]|nr:SDR family NAD(P)-dependent oxidoreductase [Gemmatimonadota bacterium]